jgi:phosphoribosylaminoimidazolecarboxamide formyltransferase / IMP cyclohydrolase
MLTASERMAHTAFLKGVALSSDAFFPFPDSVYRAYQSGVSYIAAPSGSIQDSAVVSAADEHNLVLVHTNIRLFHH